MTTDIQNRENSQLPAYMAEFKAIPKPTTYEDILKCTSLKLRPFVAKYGSEALEDVFMVVLSSLSSGLGIAVNPVMLSDAASLIIQEYPDTKMSDILLFKNEILLGHIGGQVGDQLWKWNTRTIMLTWQEYYEKRENVFCDERERLNGLAKHEYETGYAKSYANAPESVKTLVQDTVKKMEDLARKSSREKIYSAQMTLEQIAELENVDFKHLAEAIIKKADQIKADTDMDLPIEAFRAKAMGDVLYEARKDTKFLHSFIAEINK